MGPYVPGQLIKAMFKKHIQINGERALITEFTFKENCPDLCNTRAIAVIHELGENYEIEIIAYNPWAALQEVKAEYNLTLTDTPTAAIYDAILLAVAHTLFYEQGVENLRNYLKPNYVFFDLKGIFPATASDLRL